MNISKTLLAGLAALALGAGAAMAQEGPIVPSPTDWAATPGNFDRLAHTTASPDQNTPQAGAADRLPTDYSISEGLMAGGG